MNTLFITGGQFVASVIDGVFANVPHGWRYMLGIAAIHHDAFTVFKVPNKQILVLLSKPKYSNLTYEQY